METVLSIAGSIASIFAAIWAVVYARRSSNFAKKAKELRDEIVDRRQLIEISQVHSETRRILAVLADVGPTSTSTSIKGLNCSSIARQVEEYVRFLTEQRAHFSQMFDNRATELCNNLRPEIENLAQARSFAAIRSAGSALYYLILEFQPVVKELTDNRRER